MKKLIFIYSFLFLLVSGAAQNVFAATEAEAAVVHEKISVGTYDLSGMSEDEREWFITFLKGNFFADGWEQIASDILTNTHADEREDQRVRLEELGFKIGSEWCKGNDSRKIHTSMLRKWGHELKTCAAESPHLLPEVLQQIDSEVEELLN